VEIAEIIAKTLITDASELSSYRNGAVVARPETLARRLAKIAPFLRK
jgi:hypothetical protein